jgi:hypothetical protein
MHLVRRGAAVAIGWTEAVWEEYRSVPEKVRHGLGYSIENAKALGLAIPDDIAASWRETRIVAAEAALTKAEEEAAAKRAALAAARGEA